MIISAMASPAQAYILGLLRECRTTKHLEHARQAHSFIFYNGLDLNGGLGEYLIHLFSSHRCLIEAHEVFNKTPKPTIYTWAAIIMANAKLGHGQNALELYSRMHLQEISADKCIYLAALKACSVTRFLLQGRIIHDRISRDRVHSEVVIGNSIVDMYAKCNSLYEAQKVFDQLPTKDVVSWNAIITGYCQHKEGHLALDCVDKMQWQLISWKKNNVEYEHHPAAVNLVLKNEAGTIRPNEVTFLCILKSCTSIGGLSQGRFAHEQIISSGFHSVLAVANTLVDMYAKCGSLKEAHNVFKQMQTQDVVSWNAIITGHVQSGDGWLALDCFARMQEGYVTPNEVTFLSMLKVCASLEALEHGRVIHEQIMEAKSCLDLAVGNTLVYMYATCRSMKEAYSIFFKLPNQDVVSWNAIIGGYTQNEDPLLALKYFEKMQHSRIQPNQVTFLNTLKACASIGAIEQGRSVHNQIIEYKLQSDALLGNSLVDMYSKSGSLMEAQNVFENLPAWDVVSWNAMISGYFEHGEINLAVECFNKMELAGIRADITSWNAMITGYALHGAGILAIEYFERMQAEDVTPNVISWNAMIAGHVQSGEAFSALQCFKLMEHVGMEPNELTFSSILKACSMIGILQYGRLIHDKIISSGHQRDSIVAVALIDMYTKCGSLEEGCNAFDRLPRRDLILWNTMITGYTQHGCVNGALECFKSMQNEGMTPDIVSWNAIITGCAHIGESRLALEWLDKMCKEDFEANQITFLSALKACTNIGELGQGRLIHEEIIKRGLEIDIVVGSTLMDMYAKCGSLEEACKVFNILTGRDLVLWNAVLSGYAQHGDGFWVLKSFEKMQQEGISPDAVSFTSVLIACSRIGLVEEGSWHFRQMKNHKIVPNISNCTCMVDLLGRAGYFIEAQNLIQDTMPTDISGWTSLLNACRMHDNFDIAKYCFDQIILLNSGRAGAYVLMANVLADARILGVLESL